MKNVNEPKVKNSTSLQIAFNTYIKLKNELDEFWESTPPEIRNLVYGDDRMFINRDDAIRWLLTPHPDLDNKSPAESKTDKVKALINSYRTGLPL